MYPRPADVRPVAAMCAQLMYARRLAWARPPRGASCAIA